jgi:hypothetical protein
MQISAVVDNKPTFDISTALGSREVVAVRSLMTAAGIEQPKTKIRLSDLDAKLSASRLTIQQRLEVKVALNRAGLIAD